MLPMEMMNKLHDYTDIPFDYHIMAEHPETIIEKLVIKPGDIIAVHYESTSHLQLLLTKVKEKGAKAAVAINPGTPFSVLSEVLPELDMVLLMSVNPGFGGQKFINIVPKLERLMAMCNEQGVSPLIQVDGGITPETAPLVVNAGANVLVAGSAVFGKPDRKAAIEALR